MTRWKICICAWPPSITIRYDSYDSTDKHAIVRSILRITEKYLVCKSKSPYIVASRGKASRRFFAMQQQTTTTTAAATVDASDTRIVSATLPIDDMRPLVPREMNLSEDCKSDVSQVGSSVSEISKTDMRLFSVLANPEKVDFTTTLRPLPTGAPIPSRTRPRGEAKAKAAKSKPIAKIPPPTSTIDHPTITNNNNDNDNVAVIQTTSSSPPPPPHTPSITGSRTRKKQSVASLPHTSSSSLSQQVDSPRPVSTAPIIDWSKQSRNDSPSIAPIEWTTSIPTDPFAPEGLFSQAVESTLQQEAQASLYRAPDPVDNPDPPLPPPLSPSQQQPPQQPYVSDNASRTSRNPFIDPIVPPPSSSPESTSTYLFGTNPFDKPPSSSSSSSSSSSAPWTPFDDPQPSFSSQSKMNGGGDGGGSTGGGGGRHRKKHESDDDNDDSEKDDEEEMREKQELLLRLEKLEMLGGCTLTRKFTMKDSVADIQYELERHLNNKESVGAIQTIRDGLKCVAGLCDLGNNMIGPVLPLAGFAEKWCDTVDKNDGAVEGIYRKYFSKRGGSSSPEMTLLLAFVGALIMTIAKNKLPKMIFNRGKKKSKQQQHANNRRHRHHRRKRRNDDDDDDDDDDEDDDDDTDDGSIRVPPLRQSHAVPPPTAQWNYGHPYATTPPAWSYAYAPSPSYVPQQQQQQPQFYPAAVPPPSPQPNDPIVYATPPPTPTSVPQPTTASPGRRITRRIAPLQRK